MDRLEKILCLYGRKRGKIEICLKLRLRVTPCYEDFKVFNTAITRKEYECYAPHLKNGISTNDKILFRIITPLFNKYENKNNDGDSTRKWLQTKLDEMVTLMNGNPKRASYDTESLLILAEKYYMEYKQTSQTADRIIIQKT